MTCPSCGSPLTVNETLQKCVCNYCGKEIILKDDVIHINNNVTNTASYTTTQHIQKTIYGREKTEAEDFIRNGEVFLSLREFDKAKVAFTNAVEANPADYRGWMGLVAVHTRNYTFLEDEVHDGYLDKALCVADASQTEEIYAVYGSYEEKRGEAYEVGRLEEEAECRRLEEKKRDRQKRDALAEEARRQSEYARSEAKREVAKKRCKKFLLIHYLIGCFSVISSVSIFFQDKISLNFFAFAFIFSALGAVVLPCLVVWSFRRGKNEVYSEFKGQYRALTIVLCILVILDIAALFFLENAENGPFADYLYFRIEAISLDGMAFCGVQTENNALTTLCFEL